MIWRICLWKYKISHKEVHCTNVFQLQHHKANKERIKNKQSRNFSNIFISAQFHARWPHVTMLFVDRGWHPSPCWPSLEWVQENIWKCSYFLIYKSRMLFYVFWKPWFSEDKDIETADIKMIYILISSKASIVHNKHIIYVAYLKLSLLPSWLCLLFQRISSANFLSSAFKSFNKTGGAIKMWTQGEILTEHIYNSDKMKHLFNCFKPFLLTRFSPSLLLMVLFVCRCRPFLLSISIRLSCPPVFGRVLWWMISPPVHHTIFCPFFRSRPPHGFFIRLSSFPESMETNTESFKYKEGILAYNTDIVWACNRVQTFFTFLIWCYKVHTKDAGVIVITTIKHIIL